jgi:hypothetical protein
LGKLTLPAPARCLKALLAMVLPLPPPPLFCGEDNTRSTNANSIPAALAHAVCRMLKARALSGPSRPGPRAAKTVKATTAMTMATPAAVAEN